MHRLKTSFKQRIYSQVLLLLCMSLFIVHRCCFLMPAEGFIAKDLQILISLMGILFSSIMFEQYT